MSLISRKYPCLKYTTFAFIFLFHCRPIHGNIISKQLHNPVADALLLLEQVWVVLEEFLRRAKQRVRENESEAQSAELQRK